MIRFLIAIVIIGSFFPCDAKDLAQRLSERDYQEQWATENGGRVEVVMPDKTRCDIVTGTHAIEVDFARKWAEAIGQSLYYALQTNKRAGIVLILEEPNEYRFALRLGSVIEVNGLSIDVYYVGFGAEKLKLDGKWIMPRK